MNGIVEVAGYLTVICRSTTESETDSACRTSEGYVREPVRRAAKRLPPSFVLEVTARPDGNVTFTGISPHLFAGRGRSQ